MTRETKIGLLVGLAFIIVIGILLSDHLTSATEPPQAPLAQAGNDVRRAVTTPGGASAPVTQVQVPQQVAPGSAVATTQELTPRQPPVTVVQIGPASANTPATQPAQTQVATGSAPQQAATQPTTPENPAPPAAGNSTLEQVANTMNEPIVPVGQTSNPPGGNTQQPAQNQNNQQVASNTNGQRQYKAQPGDSLSKMAARFYGTSNKSTQQLILDANPTLKQNPDMIVVGRSYNIPAAAGATASAQQPQQASVPLPNVPKLAENVVIVHEQANAAQKPANAPIASSPAYTYTVKSGDTLRKIATAQLGTPDAVNAIVELNKDKIKDKNAIVVGMKLRLPAKPVTAVAQNQ